jgi:hypothetical protein
MTEKKKKAQLINKKREPLTPDKLRELSALFIYLIRFVM